MLGAQLVANVLEQSLTESAIIACAVISMEGVVLESREGTTSPKDVISKIDGTDLNYQISSKLQVKVFSLFAAEYWKQSEEAVWLGAEAHNRRLVISHIEGESLLLLVIGEKHQSWGELSKAAIDAASKLQQ